MKWYFWIGWFLFLISSMFDGHYFLTKYKKEISLDNEQDAIKIYYFLREEHKDANIMNVRLGGNFPVTGLFKDLIETRHPNADINSVKSVFYEVETDTTLYHYVTLFEIKNSFMKEEIGEKLLTGRNYFFGLAR